MKLTVSTPFVSLKPHFAAAKSAGKASSQASPVLDSFKRPPRFGTDSAENAQASPEIIAERIRDQKIDTLYALMTGKSDPTQVVNFLPLVAGWIPGHVVLIDNKPQVGVLFHIPEVEFVQDTFNQWVKAPHLPPVAEPGHDVPSHLLKMGVLQEVTGKVKTGVMNDQGFSPVYLYQGMPVQFLAAGGPNELL
jgi:hypothetical protein